MNVDDAIRLPAALPDDVLQVRDDAVRSLAQALDISPEILDQGHVNNHWTSWHTRAHGEFTRQAGEILRRCGPGCDP